MLDKIEVGKTYEGGTGGHFAVLDVGEKLVFARAWDGSEGTFGIDYVKLHWSPLPSPVEEGVIWRTGAMRILKDGRLMRLITDGSDAMNLDRHCCATAHEIAKAYADLYAKCHPTPEPEEWPGEGDQYWLVYTDGSIGAATWLKDPVIDRGRQRQGNCFRSYEEAQSAAERVRMWLEDMGLEKFAMHQLSESQPVNIGLYYGLSASDITATDWEVVE